MRKLLAMGVLLLVPNSAFATFDPFRTWVVTMTPKFHSCEGGWSGKNVLVWNINGRGAGVDVDVGGNTQYKQLSGDYDLKKSIDVFGTGNIPQLVIRFKLTAKSDTAMSGFALNTWADGKRFCSTYWTVAAKRQD